MDELKDRPLDRSEVPDQDEPKEHPPASDPASQPEPESAERPAYFPKSSANRPPQAQQPASSPSIERLRVLDFLSECLTTGKGGLALYETALKQVHTPEIKDRFQVFCEETREHVAIVARAMDALHAAANHMSAGARAHEYHGKAFLHTLDSGLVPGTTTTTDEAELIAVRNILMAEANNRVNWQLLSSIASTINDPEARDVLSAACNQVMPQEDEHLKWTSDQYMQLALRYVTGQ